MNYESMSDFEINKEVASIKGLYWYISPDKSHTAGWIYSDNYNEVCERHARHEAVELPDYCSNPSDAWPIIISNKITIIDLGNEYIAVHGFQLSDDQYRDNVADWSLEARDKNPLRAAMIVFLMMNENK